MPCDWSIIYFNKCIAMKHGTCDHSEHCEWHFVCISLTIQSFGTEFCKLPCSVTQIYSRVLKENKNNKIIKIVQCIIMIFWNDFLKIICITSKTDFILQIYTRASICIFANTDKTQISLWCVLGQTLVSEQWTQIRPCHGDCMAYFFAWV